MTLRNRCVCPEELDELAPEDPRAERSRRDLQRVHRVMRSLSVLERAISRLRLLHPPKRIIEVGAGDGTLMLRLAGALEPHWAQVELTLLDRRRAVSAKTLEEFRTLGWRVTVACEDALAWARPPLAASYDLCITTLFLHHFQDRELKGLLQGIAARAHAFVALEPRRETLANIGSHLIGLLGTNSITRADAVKSVAAGFVGRELTAAWPGNQDAWWMEEFHALPFSHCFVAARDSVRESSR